MVITFDNARLKAEFDDWPIGGGNHGCYCNINDRGTYYVHLIEADHYAG